VPEPIEDAPVLGVVVRVVKPIRASECFVAVDLDDDIRDVVSSGWGSKPGRRGWVRIRAITSLIASRPFTSPLP
jgi:hypothetical protein